MAIIKVGICNSGVAMLGHDIGESYADLITIDDYFCDMSAKSRKSMQYEGNDYWMSKNSAEALFDMKLEADDHTVIGEQGETRAESVSVDKGLTFIKRKYGFETFTSTKTISCSHIL